MIDRETETPWAPLVDASADERAELVRLATAQWTAVKAECRAGRALRLAELTYEADSSYENLNRVSQAREAYDAAVAAAGAL